MLIYSEEIIVNTDCISAIFILRQQFEKYLICADSTIIKNCNNKEEAKEELKNILNALDNGFAKYKI